MKEEELKKEIERLENKIKNIPVKNRRRMDMDKYYYLLGMLKQHKRSFLAGQNSQKEKITKILTEWWRDENICSGENCCIKECDLCVNCFQDLCKRFGCEWNKDNKGDKVFLK